MLRSNVIPHLMRDPELRYRPRIKVNGKGLLTTIPTTSLLCQSIFQYIRKLLNQRKCILLLTIRLHMRLNMLALMKKEVSVKMQ